MSYYSINQYTGTGAQTAYPITFPYLDKTHVEVRVNSVLKTLTTDYTWSNASTILMNSAPANGLVVDIRRNTPKTARLVDFQDASTLTESTLDYDSNQTFYVSQETLDIAAGALMVASDGTYDALNKRIKNVADPVNAQDVATKTYVDSSLPASVSSASASASSASASASSATISAAAAAASASSALFRTSATGSVIAAKGTTAQRDGSPLTGYIRYNTTNNEFEGYGGATPQWGSIGGGANSFAQDNLNVPASTGRSLVGPITFTGTTTISGRLVIL